MRKMGKLIRSFMRSASHFGPSKSEVARKGRSLGLTYQYDNCAAQPFYWKTERWRDTGDFACFFRQRVKGPFGSWTETYILVYRDGRFHEVAQWGLKTSKWRKRVR